MSLTSHWLLSDNRARIGLAVALPCVLLALTPTLTHAWKRIAAKNPVRATSPPPPSSSETVPAPTPAPNKKPVIAPPAPPPFDRIPASSPVTSYEKQADNIPIAKEEQTAKPSRRPLPDLPSSDDSSPKETDTFSVGSGDSSEHKPRKLRVGKNLKRAWSNRPFAHAHEPEPLVWPLSPESR